MQEIDDVTVRRAQAAPDSTRAEVIHALGGLFADAEDVWLDLWDQQRQEIVETLEARGAIVMSDGERESVLTISALEIETEITRILARRAIKEAALPDAERDRFLRMVKRMQTPEDARRLRILVKQHDRRNVGVTRAGLRLADAEDQLVGRLIASRILRPSRSACLRHRAPRGRRVRRSFGVAQARSPGAGRRRRADDSDPAVALAPGVA